MNDEDFFALFDGIDAVAPDAEGPVDFWTEFEQVVDCLTAEDVWVGGCEDPVEQDVGVGPDNAADASGIVAITGDAGSVFDPVFRIFDDFWYGLNGQDDIVTEHHFTDNGNYDVKNNVIVEGNVADDIKYVDQQTHGSCSLMAQEQFVERYTGQPIPEDYLEWRAEQWGVYDPDIGTDWGGQTMVLDHFHIPYERHLFSDLSDLDEALQSDNDMIIGVDARSFYGDSSIPPGSGHAVAVVGRGIDPETHEVKGYYVTDSNFSETAHFVDAERLNDSWGGDMIVIPNKSMA